MLVMRHKYLKLIIDTDAGSDDGVAIFLALNSAALDETFDIIALTAVDGNTNVDNVGRNLLKVLKTAKRLDIPIYKGSNYSLIKTPESDNYFGRDGFGDFEFPDPPPESLIKEQHAALFLVEAVKANPGNVTILCIGPLTNLALAIRLDPSFLENVYQIVMLGGSVHGEGNVKPGIEFNIYVDPEAAHIVWTEAEKSSKVIKVVPWETAKKAFISWDWRRNVLGAIQSPIIEVLNKAEEIAATGPQWYFSDSIAVAATLFPTFQNTSNEIYGVVELCGNHGRGITILDYDQSVPRKPQLQIVENIDVESLKDIFIKYLGYVPQKVTKE